ncbi:MAG: alpha/beta fold hydrolase, partial [Candidatus Binataceae bacterium]
MGYEFVLIHGSWHDGAAWGQVVSRLASQGHRAHAPTLAGHGKNVPKNVSHAECVQSAIDYVVKNDLSDFVLVGHSFAGTVISKMAEAITGRIRRLVFWNAFVPLDGNSLDDETPPHYRSTFKELANSTADQTVMLPYRIWREAFINDAD